MAVVIAAESCYHLSMAKGGKRPVEATSDSALDRTSADSILYGSQASRGAAGTDGLFLEVLDDGVIEYHDHDGRLVKLIVPAYMEYQIHDVKWNAFTETEAWLDADGRLHRDPDPSGEVGPAMIAEGNNWWYKHGVLHRDPGPSGEIEPAVLHADGTKEWYQDGLAHREDGPAIEYADGGSSYYLDGHLFRDHSTWYDYKAWKDDPLASRAGWHRNGIYWERTKDWM